SATRPARRAATRLARPGTAVCSCTTSGTRARTAARATGSATKPPVANTTRGRSRRSNRHACSTPAGALTQTSGTFCHASARRSLPVRIAWYAMPTSGARRASSPVRLPIHAQGRPRSRSAAAPPRGRRSIVVPGIPMTLECQADQALDELAVGEAGGLPEPCVGAGRREAGDGVDLVQDDAIALEEEVDARHARGVDGPKRRHRG